MAAITENDPVRRLFKAFHDHEFADKCGLCDELRNLIKNKSVSGSGTIAAMIDADMSALCSKRLIEAVHVILGREDPATIAHEDDGAHAAQSDREAAARGAAAQLAEELRTQNAAATAAAEAPAETPVVRHGRIVRANRNPLSPSTPVMKSPVRRNTVLFITEGLRTVVDGLGAIAEDETYDKLDMMASNMELYAQMLRTMSTR